MEKRAIISPEHTPPEDNTPPTADEKRAQVLQLDADLRKRLATAAQQTAKA
jgi:hypothetical protein